MTALRDGDAVRLHLKSDPRHLCLVRAMVRSFGELAGFGDERLHRVVLAVDEACANIVRHAYRGSPDGDIEVACSVELRQGSTRLVVQLLDWGAAIESKEPVPLEKRDPLVPGGLGLHLMRDIMDSVEFRHRDDGCNLLEMTVACP